jgi:hypothetical protein
VALLIFAVVTVLAFSVGFGLNRLLLVMGILG